MIGSHSKPRCQIFKDRRKDTRYRCQAALLDESKKKVLIVYENSYPINLRRWGFPKGKIKKGETNTECVHREVCEEVGIELRNYPHSYCKQGRDHIIVIHRPAEAIYLHLGPEILKAVWVDIAWLKNDVERDQALVKNNINHTNKYNARLRSLVRKL